MPLKNVRLLLLMHVFSSSLISCVYILPSDSCNVTAVNKTGAEKCCFLPFEYGGQMFYHCSEGLLEAKGYTCPLDRFNIHWGVCREYCNFMLS